MNRIVSGSRDATEISIQRLTNSTANQTDTQSLQSEELFRSSPDNSSEKDGSSEVAFKKLTSTQKRCGSDKTKNKSKRKKPNMTKSRDDPYGPFGGVEDSSNTSDGKQPLLSDDDFMDSYKQFKNDTSVPGEDVSSPEQSPPLKSAEAKTSSKDSVSKKSNEMKGSKNSFGELGELKDIMRRVEQKLDTIMSNKVLATSELGSCSMLLDDTSNPPSPEVYHGVTLTKLPCSANSPQKYARKVMSQVFSDLENY